MPPTAVRNSADLLQQITTALAVLNHCASVSDIPTTIDSTSAHRTHNPLTTLSDSARLIKAHTTKLSLLAINKPFTPSAISQIIHQLTETCLAASTICIQINGVERHKYGETLSTEVRLRAARVFSELKSLLGEVRAIANGEDSAGGRNSLTSTGVVWEACDALAQLEQLGIVGIVVQKANEYLDTVKDALAELREWREGGDPENEGRADQLLDSDDEGVAGDDESMEDLFNAANSLPKDQPELAELAEKAEDKIKKIVLLYNAVIKRRLKTFKPEDNDAKRIETLDCLMRDLKRLPPEVDELLADRFYSLDQEGAREKLQEILDISQHVVATVGSSWQGQDDEFTAWSRKWQEAINRDSIPTSNSVT